MTTPKPVFYKSLPTLTKRYTSYLFVIRYMAKVIIEIIEQVELGKEFCIVTDNSANIKKLRCEVDLFISNNSTSHHTVISY